MLKILETTDIFSILNEMKLFDKEPKNLKELEKQLQNDKVNKTLTSFENIDQYLNHYLMCDSLNIAIFCKNINDLKNLNIDKKEIDIFEHKPQLNAFKYRKKYSESLKEDQYYHIDIDYKTFSKKRNFEKLYQNIIVNNKDYLYLLGNYNDLFLNILFKLKNKVIIEAKNYFKLSDSENVLEDIIYSLALLTKLFDNLETIKKLDINFILDESQIDSLRYWN